MKRRAFLYKEVGETPLAALTRWKAAHPAYAAVPASYAGRLDPMAEGKLLILLGEECKKQKKYALLDKEYEVEVLFDVGSDTGDALGIVSSGGKETNRDDAELKRILKAEEGTHTRPYPAYSSKPVDGKPLFLHALEGNEVKAPLHEERLYSIKLLGVAQVNETQLSERVLAHLAKAPTSDEPSKALGADFRIKDVRASWEPVLKDKRQYAIARIRVACGSGTYMRALGGRIGEALGTKALALSIKRTNIGRRIGPFFLPI